MRAEPDERLLDEVLGGGLVVDEPASHLDQSGRLVPEQAQQQGVVVHADVAHSGEPRHRFAHRCHHLYGHARAHVLG